MTNDPVEMRAQSFDAYMRGCYLLVRVIEPIVAMGMGGSAMRASGRLARMRFNMRLIVRGILRPHKQTIILHRHCHSVWLELKSEEFERMVGPIDLSMG